MRATTVLRSLLLGAVLVASAAAPLTAQEPAQYLYVVTLTPKLDQLGAFEDFERQIAEARRRTGDTRSVYVHQVTAGGPINRFHVVIPFGDFSELESWPSVPALLAAGFGEREGARIYQAGIATEESVEIAVQVLQPEYTSSAVSASSGASITHLVTTRINPQRVGDYDAFLSALSAAEEKRGIRRIRRAVTMGDLYTYTAVSQSEGWADVRATPGPGALIVEDLGDEMGERLLAQADAAVVGRTIEVLRYREDLSYQPD
jgi:hypothetical protein